MQSEEQVTDEVLSGYLDNQLSAKERLTISALLLEDATLQQRFAKLYAQEQTLKIFADTFAPVEPNSPSNGAKIVPFPSTKTPELATSSRFSYTAIAASVTFVVGLSALLFSSQWWEPQATNPSGGLGNSAKILATQPSGQYQVDDQLLTLQFSFRHVDGGYCRVFNLDSADWQTTNIACQQGDAPWRIQFSQGRPTQGNGDTYLAASASEGLDRVIDPMINGQPLNAEAEQQAIAQQWR